MPNESSNSKLEIALKVSASRENGDEEFESSLTEYKATLRKLPSQSFEASEGLLQYFEKYRTTIRARFCRTHCLSLSSHLLMRCLWSLLLHSLCGGIPNCGVDIAPQSRRRMHHLLAHRKSTPSAMVMWANRFPPQQKKEFRPALSSRISLDRDSQFPPRGHCERAAQFQERYSMNRATRCGPQRGYLINRRAKSSSDKERLAAVARNGFRRRPHQSHQIMCADAYNRLFLCGCAPWFAFSAPFAHLFGAVPHASFRPTPFARARQMPPPTELTPCGPQIRVSGKPSFFSLPCVPNLGCANATCL